MIREGALGQRVRYNSHYQRFKSGRTTETNDVVTEVDFDANRGNTATIIGIVKSNSSAKRYRIRLEPPNKGVLEVSPKELSILKGM